MATNHPSSGIHFVPAYQISGIPFVTSSACTSTAVRTIQFPLVTRHVTIANNDGTNRLMVAFTSGGLNTTLNGNMFYVPTNTVVGPLEIRTDKLVFASTAAAQHNFSVIAGLTTIDSTEWVVTGSNDFPGVG